MSAVLEIPARSTPTRKPLNWQSGSPEPDKLDPAMAIHAVEASAPRRADSKASASQAESPERIVLTGFMGSGKTSVGSLLAERLGWRFLDLDREIERREGRTVPGIFAESGEAHFRRLESKTLAALLGERRVVVALGGGAPEELGNRLLLEQTPRTTLIYLCAPLPTLLERCQKDAGKPGTTERPLLVDADSRFRVRHPLYERISSHRIETASLDLDQVVAAVLGALRMDL